MARDSTARARTEGVPFPNDGGPLRQQKFLWLVDSPDAPAVLEVRAARHLVAFHRGYMCATAGDFEKALGLFRKAVDLKPDFGEACFNIGQALDALGRREDAIAAYDDLLARLGAAPELPLRELVAQALVNKGYSLGALGRSEDAIAAYDNLLARFGTAAELPLSKPVATALFGKGYNLGTLGRSEEEIAIYDDLLARVGTATELPLRELVARALINKGFWLTTLGRSEDAIAVYDDLLARVGTTAELPLRELVARALVSKGFRLGTLGRSKDAIAVYDDLLARFGTTAELPLREPVAQALANKGYSLGMLGRREDAIAVYDDLLARFGTAAELSLREQVAQALANKGYNLGILGRSEDAIAVYDDLLARFGTAAELSLREEVVQALVSKGFSLLGKLGRFPDAVATFHKASEVAQNIKTRQGAELYIEERLNQEVVNNLGVANLTIESYNRDDYSSIIVDDAAKARLASATELPHDLRDTLATIKTHQRAFALLTEILERSPRPEILEERLVAIRDDERVFQSSGAAEETTARHAMAEARAHETAPEHQSKPARPKFRERTGDDLKLSPPEFVKIAYSRERADGTLHKGLIHRDDPGLYTDLHNWLRDPQNRMPDDLDLPTYHEWNTRRRADPATQEAIRLQEVERGRRRREGETQRPPGRPRKADKQASVG
jgi:tetratricopeptide (TPR) repeat protein